MKLWILRPIEGPAEVDPWSPWYDKAFGFIVRAKTEEEARQFAHVQAGDENRENKSGTTTPWLDANYSSCRPLDKSGVAGVVMRDFNAA